jgi:uncharacterized repeat protein (TIGR01451 family)
MSLRHRSLRSKLAALAGSILLLPITMVGAATAGPAVDDTPSYRAGTQPLTIDEETEQELLARDLSYIQNRLAGDRPLSISEAGALRSQAAKDAKRLRELGGTAPTDPSSLTGAWTALGPNPIVQGLRSPDPEGQRFGAMAGRIGALAIVPSTHQIILGGAQGGIWLFDWNTGVWTAETDAMPSLAIGALAVAPSNDQIVYAGTGEGAFSGDSYFGNGILKSTDGGQTWTHVSGDYFVAVSSSAIVVDPTNPNHLYVSTMRGRGGNHRTSPALHSKFGVWESKDGGVTWTLILDPKNPYGATDLAIDPQDANILFTSVMGDKIYKSTDAGRHWAPAMTGLPAANYAAAPTRFSLGISHPAGHAAVLYAGFAYEDVHAHVYRSDNLGASWSVLPDGTGDDSVDDYCAEQCTYDNVIEADPNNADVVFAAGQFNYGIGSGGIFRSDDGGQTWKNLGWDQHPDFHALAFDSSTPGDVVMGNDGGVWFGDSYGGRPSTSDPLDAVTWIDLNGGVSPYTAGVTYRTGLQLGQFTSIAVVPQVAGRYWGGTQDNGTMRKSTASQSWFDMASGDGGQVLVDPTPDTCAFGSNTSCLVYGTYFGITPYRISDGGAFFFSNQYIRKGINLNDRSEFYVPFTMNKMNPNQLLLGTYRLYRTDNARTEKAADVTWKAISPDLTSGCTGTAPNGARGCLVSAIGVGGGNAVYVGTDDGLLWIATDGLTSANPTWVRLDQNGLPKRPVAEIKVDPSNYRIAYVAYNGFNAATPGTPGHLFKTTDGGAHWTNISGNLPDSPLNTVIVDPSFPNTLYAGTDVGPYVTTNGGFTWSWLGSSFPIVGVWQMDFDPARRVLVAGTHGRGAFRITDASAYPALSVSKVDAGIPVGNGSNIDYTITVRNMGGADATGVAVSDVIPANTSFVSAGDGGTVSAGTVRWTGITVAAGSSVDLHFSVSIANALKKKVASITNDGITVTSAQGQGATGSPTITPIAPPYAVTVSTGNANGVAKAGESVSYHVSVKNLGYTTDSYDVSTTGGTYTASIFQSDCSTPTTSTGALVGGASADLCVTVDVPGGAAQGDTDVKSFVATSVGSATVSGSVSFTTSAVTVATLLVDQDLDAPDTRTYYTDALTAAGIDFGVYDIAGGAQLPIGLLQAYSNVVWYTGNTYPGPILPYETQLTAFLDGGGRLFLNGQDLLDQAAGTTDFVHDYLHISWDGTEAQNDKRTDAVHSVAGTLTDGIGDVTIDHTVLGATFEDRITPIGPAVGIFTDDSAATDALSVDTGTYRVVFLAFPFEAYGTADQKTALMSDVFSFLTAP